MAIVGILALHLAGACRQQVLEGPKTVFDPVPPLPGPDEPWPADSGVEAHDIELLLPGCTDHDERHYAIGRTGGAQPRIAHPWHLRTRPPGPLVVLLQVVALDLPPIGQCEGVGTLPFHEKRPLVGRRDMAHELRIAKPAIGHDHRWGQLDAAPTKSRYTSVQHDLHPVQFVTAWRPSAYGVRPTDGKVDRHHQLALTNNHDEQHPINPGEHPVFLATPPFSRQAQLLAVFFEHRVIAHPGPLPTAACGLTLAGGVTP